MSGIPNNNGIKIGKYDTGIFDLASDVTIKKTASVNTKDEAMNLAKKSFGADLVVERNDTKKGVVFDVYGLNVNDKNKSVRKLQDMNNMRLTDRTLNVIEKATNTSNSVKGFVVAENGDVSKPIYNSQFSRTNYDKMRETLGLEHNKTWFKIVDKVMGSDTPPDNLPNIDKKEIKDMESHLKPGDMILNGNDGSFIHGILYVGKDPALQAQLEKQWNLPKGALKDEGIIIHSLLTDSDKEVTVDGKKQVIKASGQGVHADTIERYLERHPRDVMLGVEVKGASDTDRQKAVDTAKSFIGKGYDRAFNTYDDSQMYCTEAVMKAWQNTSNPPKFETQRNPLVSYPKFVLDKLPAKIASKLQDGGFMHQEMIMTDGLATSPSTSVVWASQNADKSEFIKKHERWANGVEGKVNEDYKAMLLRDVPEEASRSASLVEKVKELSARTRNEVK